MNKDLKIIFITSGIIFILLVSIIIVIKKGDNLTNNIQYGKYKDEEELKNVLLKSFEFYSRCQTGKDFNITNTNIASIDTFTEDEIMNIVYNYLTENNKVEVKSNIDNKSKMRNFIYSFSKKEVEETIKDLFGKEYQKNNQLKNSYNIRGGNFELKNDVYVGEVSLLPCSIGSYTRFYNYNTYISEDKFYIEYALYWYMLYELDSGNIGYAYNSKEMLEPTCLEENIEDNLDNFTKYRFVFVREDDNFIFDHIELVQ